MKKLKKNARKTRTKVKWQSGIIKIAGQMSVEMKCSSWKSFIELWHETGNCESKRRTFKCKSLWLTISLTAICNFCIVFYPQKAKQTSVNFAILKLFENQWRISVFIWHEFVVQSIFENNTPIDSKWLSILGNGAPPSCWQIVEYFKLSQKIIQCIPHSPTVPRSWIKDEKCVPKEISAGQTQLCTAISHFRSGHKSYRFLS